MADRVAGGPAKPHAALEHRSSWVDAVEVDERKLQEYMCQRQHTLLLKGAATAMRHTLEPTPTSGVLDGFLHFGDSLMILSHFTQGLLQSDIGEDVPVADGSSACVTGASLSTGRTVGACPRNVFTLSRADDDDGFGDSAYVHYGQPFRMGCSTALSEKSMYLFASRDTTEELQEGETLMCVYPRARPGTRWRVLRPGDGGEGGGAGGEVVKIASPVVLESLATGHCLRSDTTVRMNNYGNEYRVFGASTLQEASAGHCEGADVWSFVNSEWTDEVMKMARSRGINANCAGVLDICRGGVCISESSSRGAVDGPATLPRRLPPHGGASHDPVELLWNPIALADHELQLLEREVSDELVLLRLHPELRRAGMHVVRKLRRMCRNADVDCSGMLPVRTFEGVLSYFAVRLEAGELQKLVNLLGDQHKQDPDIQLIDYRKFFKLMEPTMSDLRVGIVQDAYARLERLGRGSVELSDLQRLWDPQSHPEYARGDMSEAEARDEFFNQWESCNADGIVSSEEFMDYYRDVSMAVEHDAIFIELVRRTWGL